MKSEQHTQHESMSSSSEPVLDMNSNIKTILLYSNNYLMAFSQHLYLELDRTEDQSSNI